MVSLQCMFGFFFFFFFFFLLFIYLSGVFVQTMHKLPPAPPSFPTYVRPLLRWKRGRELVHCLYKTSRHVHQPPVGPQNLTWLFICIFNIGCASMVCVLLHLCVLSIKLSCYSSSVMRWRKRGRLCNETGWNGMTRLDGMIGSETGFFGEGCEAMEPRTETGRHGLTSNKLMNTFSFSFCTMYFFFL